MDNAYNTIELERDGIQVNVNLCYDTDGWASNPREMDNLCTIVSFDRHCGADEEASDSYGFQIACPDCGGDGDDMDRWRVYEQFAGFQSRTVAIFDDEDDAGTLADKRGKVANIDLQVDNPPCRRCEGSGEIEVGPVAYYEAQSDTIAAVGLRFADYGSSGSDLFETDDENNINAVAYVTLSRAHELGIPGTGTYVPDTDVREEALRQMRGELDEYVKWIKGEVYGFVIEDESGDELDSCWGFIGEGYFEQEARSMGEAILDNLLRERETRRRKATNAALDYAMGV